MDAGQHCEGIISDHAHERAGDRLFLTLAPDAFIRQFRSGGCGAAIWLLLALIRERITELGIPYETVDEVAGFPARYVSKVMCGTRRLSIDSLITLLGTLALRVEADPARLAQLQRRSAWRRRAREGPQYGGAAACSSTGGLICAEYRFSFF